MCRIILCYKNQTEVSMSLSGMILTFQDITDNTTIWCHFLRHKVEIILAFIICSFGNTYNSIQICYCLSLPFWKLLIFRITRVIFFFFQKNCFNLWGKIGLFRCLEFCFGFGLFNVLPRNQHSSGYMEGIPWELGYPEGPWAHDSP